jgi:peptidoglycan/LPS O-acetylase OafA/YrhL
VYVAGALVFSASQFSDQHFLYTGLLVGFGPTATALATILIISTFELSVRLSNPSWIVRRTQWFGILTYAIYVCHEPIYTAVRRWAPGELNVSQAIVWSGIGLVLSTMVAAVLYAFVERPFDSAKRWFPRQVHVPSQQ